MHLQPVKEDGVLADHLFKKPHFARQLKQRRSLAREREEIYE